MRIRNWFKKREVLVDFLLHIPWIFWGTFLGIMERIGESVKGSLVFRLAGTIILYLGFFLGAIIVLALAVGLRFIALFVDPKSKLRRFLRLAVEFSELPIIVVKSFGIIALAVLLISVTLIVDFAVDRKMPSL